MTSSNTLLKKIIGVKDVVVTDAEIYSDHDGVTHLTIDARLNSWNQNKSPFCGRTKLPGYDKTITISKDVERPGSWRSNGGHQVSDQPHRMS